MTAGNGSSADADPVAVCERAVLGACVGSLDAAREAAGVLEPRHFRHSAYAAVFTAVTRLAAAPVPVVEPAAVIAELGAGGFGDWDPAPLVYDLAGHAGDIRHHAPLVLAAWQQRNLRAALAAAADMAEADRWDPQVTPGQIRDLISDAATVTGPSRLRDPAELLAGVLGSLEDGAPPALPTPYPELDELTGGWGPGQMIVVGARASIGKSLLATCMADHVGTGLDLPVLYSSPEMTERELTLRRISAAAGVPYTRLVRYQLTDGDWDRIRDVHAHLAASSLRIDDTSPVSLTQIRGRLGELARAGTPAALHVLDYLNLVQAPRAESRTQAVAAVVRGYREICREFGIPGLLLAQLNRGPEERRSRREPQLADLKETGELEQAADVVLLLHRPAPGEMEVIVAKNRQGPTGEVTLRFEGHYGRITSQASAWSPSAHADS